MKAQRDHLIILIEKSASEIIFL